MADKPKTLAKLGHRPKKDKSIKVDLLPQEIAIFPDTDIRKRLYVYHQIGRAFSPAIVATSLGSIFGMKESRSRAYVDKILTEYGEFIDSLSPQAKRASLTIKLEALMQRHFDSNPGAAVASAKIIKDILGVESHYSVKLDKGSRYDSSSLFDGTFLKDKEDTVDVVFDDSDSGKNGSDD